jgi:hypothetical protein
MFPPELPPIYRALQVPLLHLINIVALGIGPQNRVLQLSLTIPALMFVVSQSWYREWTGEWGLHYGMECMVIGMVWIYFDWIVLKSPDKEVWHKIRYAGKKKGEEHAKEEVKVPEGFWKRAWWGARLATGVRYVGWNCQVKNVPVEVDADYPRWYGRRLFYPAYQFSH